MIHSVKFHPKYIPAVTDLIRKYLVPNHLKRIGIESTDEVTNELMELEPMLNPNVLLDEEFFFWHYKVYQKLSWRNDIARRGDL